EKVLAYHGEATVTNTEKKADDRTISERVKYDSASSEGTAKAGLGEVVYNLEIKDLHNFLVGDLGVVVHNNYQWFINLIHFPYKNVLSHYKHAHYFGFPTNSSVENVTAFKKHLEEFVSNSNGKSYFKDINYRNQHKDALVVVEAETNLVVITNGSGEFITAYKASAKQIDDLLNKKFWW
ncbi:MAG TPA: colicin D domain-containing protein, partial [Saprospiraceae bacterium]|nr:colicin D domain-containing protein [Saprospiraceae bacterium]